jgi:hypothetical protein
MKVLKGKIVKEIMGFDGIFIEFNSDGEGMLISEDKDLDFGEFETCGDSGEVELEGGRVIKWGILSV